MVGQNDVIGHTGRNSLDPSQGTHKQGLRRNTELAGKELRNNVVNVQDELGTTPLGGPCREDQKIRDVVNVHEVEPTSTAMAKQPLGRNKDKAQEWPQKRPDRPLILPESILYAVHKDAVNQFAVWLLGRPAQCD